MRNSSAFAMSYVSFALACWIGHVTLVAITGTTILVIDL